MSNKNPAIPFLILGVVLLWRAIHAAVLGRRVTGTATSKVRSAAVGPVELKGRAYALEPLLDPIFFQPCAYYSITVKSKGRNERTFRSITGDRPFLVRDDSGVALLFPTHAKVFYEDEEKLGIFQHGSEPAVKEYLRKFGMGQTNTNVQFLILRDGDPVYVLGEAVQSSIVTSSAFDHSNPALTMTMLDFRAALDTYQAVASDPERGLPAQPSAFIRADKKKRLLLAKSESSITKSTDLDVALAVVGVLCLIIAVVIQFFREMR